MKCIHNFVLVETNNICMGVQTLKEKCSICGEERFGTYYDGRKIN